MAKRGRVLRCGKGYRFKKVGRKVMLMRRQTQGPTFTCECSTSGGCKVNIDPEDPRSISCLSSGCEGTCGWVVNIPGIVGRLSFALKV